MSTDKSDYTPTFGNRLREVRKQTGLTQQELADMSSIAKDTLSRYERGLLTPTIEAFHKIYRALVRENPNLTADDLLFEDWEENYTRYRVKNLGQVKSFLFNGGGRVVTSYDASDICGFLTALIQYEEERDSKNEQVINSLSKLVNRYRGKKLVFETEAFMATFEAKLKAKNISLSDIEKESSKPFRRIEMLHK